MLGYRSEIDVTVGPTDPDIVTQVEVSAYLGVTVAEFPALPSLVSQITDLIEGYCFTQFRTRTYTETWFDPPHSADFRLRRLPVQSIVEIRDADSAVVPTTSYEITNKSTGRLRFYDTEALCSSTDRFKLTIQYVAGFDTVPGDLAQAGLSVSQSLYSAQNVNPLAESERIDDYAITYAGGGVGGSGGGAIARMNIPQIHRQTLDRYRVLNLW